MFKLLIICIACCLITSCATINSSAAQATQNTYNQAVESSTQSIVHDIDGG